MKTKKCIKYFIPCLSVLAVAMAQAQAAETAASTVTGEITPTLTYFDYTDGPGANFTQFMERYNPQEAWSGDRDSGFYGDIDLNLTVADEKRDILILERRGFGLNNHRNSARVNTDIIGFTGYYSNYRSASGGIDYLYNPNRLPADNNGIGGTDPSYFYPAATNANSGFIAQFNDDTAGQVLFKTDRTNFGMGMKFKPQLLGGMGSISVNYDGYKRDGNKLVTYALGAGDVREAVTNTATVGRVLQRWRGMSQDVEENMHKVSLNLTASPGGMFQLSYDGSLEKFDNRAKDYTHADIVLPADWQYNTGGNISRPLGFVPDTTMMNHAIRLSKTFGNTAVAAGYGMSRLEQDSFTAPQIASGYTTGKISTDNAFLNLNHRLSSLIGLEGHIKYSSRDNDSSYPVTGLLAPTNSEELAVRINNIETLTYGLAAAFRGLPVKSSLTAGWKHDDTDRDLTFNNTGIIPSVSLYREQTVSDELYVKWVAKPMTGMTVRVTPSYLWADKTGLVTEPEESINLKTGLSYAMANGMHVNGYYNYKDKQNNNNGFTNKTVTLPAVTQNQDIDNTFHSAGASLSLMPTEKFSATVSLDWSQNDFETYYFSTDRRRYEAANNAMAFLIRGDSSFKVDTWSLSLNGDYQASDRLKLNAGYAYTLSDGSGVTIDATQVVPYVVRESIDNSLHSFILGANYALKKGMTLRGGYVYDKYDDDAYDALSSGVHTLMAGVSFAL
jgi:hypothetical protein